MIFEVQNESGDRQLFSLNKVIHVKLRINLPKMTHYRYTAK